MQNVTFQASALIGVPISEGWYLFPQDCNGEIHIIRWNPMTNAFRFDELTSSRNARDVFAQMSGKLECHCATMWRFFERCPRTNHFTLGFGEAKALHLVMVTN